MGDARWRGVAAASGELIQHLWAGYGSLRRVRLSDGSSVVVKAVSPPVSPATGDGIGHRRKLRSYAVELAFYEDIAPLLGAGAKVPKLCWGLASEGRWTLILEDLEGVYPGRHGDLEATDVGIEACLRWLGAFHGRFLWDQRTEEAPAAAARLWSQGSYWHLATRPSEWEAIEDLALATAAEGIDRRLRQGRFRTLVHGDAKIANFCFSEDRSAVAAVDFQYVGPGCPMRDLAYFRSSCLREADCERSFEAHYGIYFEALQAAANERGRFDWQACDGELRRLYSFAWADFDRFLAGWSPGHWKRHGYAAGHTAAVLRELSGDRP